MAKRYKEFGHIGLNTPFHLVHIDMQSMLEPSLFTKYEKAREFIRNKQKEKQSDDGPSLAEEIELMRKLSLENQRFVASAEKIFSEEDFMYNYDEHYPDIGDTHEQSYKGVLGRMTGDYDIPKFMRTKKPKTKKKPDEEFLDKKVEDLAGVGPIQPAPPAPVNIVVVKKVKGKNKKRH